MRDRLPASGQTAPERHQGQGRGLLPRWAGGGLLFAILALAGALPLWATEHPPIQDWPQHLAAIRVLHSYRDPAFDFQRYFVLEPTRTQYLSVYYGAAVLAHLVGVAAAAKLVLSAAIVSLPFAVRSLAREVGGAGSTGLLATPLAYSAHTILGFLNFLVALPLMIWAIAWMLRGVKQNRERDLWISAALLIVCFYTHVLPFGFAALGSLLVVLVPPWRAPWRRLLPLALVGLAVVPWLAGTPAGEAVLTVLLGRRGGGVKPTYESFDMALTQLPLWLTDVWRGDGDRWLMGAWAVLVLLWAVLGARGRRGRRETLAGEAANRMCSSAGRLWLLPLVAGVAYFLVPSSYGWIWPISARFPLLAVLLMLPLLPSPAPGVRGGLLTGIGVLVVCSVLAVAHRFQRFEQQEVHGLREVLECIPPRQRVAGLIFASGSAVVEFAPFLHAVAYYQARRGGAVMFSFADFPHSVYRYRETLRPPPVPPRWEWLPHSVDPDEDLDWYDWVLVRGGPGAMRGSQDFVVEGAVGAWSVWQRRTSPESAGAPDHPPR